MLVLPKIGIGLVELVEYLVAFFTSLRKHKQQNYFISEGQLQ